MIAGWALFSFIFLFLLVQLYLYLNFKPAIYEVPEDVKEWPSVTVLVPVRNEAGGIVACVESLIAQEYPRNKYEILVVDDHSEDDTAGILSQYPQVRLVYQESGKQGKKEAVMTGVKEASGEVILTTDGDCVMGKEWMVSMVEAVLGEDAEMVAGPVSYMPKGEVSFIQRYQTLEQNALNIITAAGLKTGLILSASGANMAFCKKTFQELNPFEDNKEIASGDDVFLVQKMRIYQKKAAYCRSQNAVVFSEPVSTFWELLRQRTRWGSKSKFYTHRPTQLYLVLFVLSKISLILLFVFSFFNSDFWNYFFLAFILQFVSDYLMIQKGMRWMHQAVCWQDVLKASLFQVFVTVCIACSVLIRIPVEWKGRR